LFGHVVASVIFYAHLDMLSLSCAILETLSFFMHIWTCCRFSCAILEMLSIFYAHVDILSFLADVSDDSSDESDDFFQNCLKWCYACPNIL